MLQIKGKKHRGYDFGDSKFSQPVDKDCQWRTWNNLKFAGATGFTFLTSVLFYGSPFILLWYVYGVATTCFPVLPTCLLADLLTAAEYVLQASIDFPQELLCANETLGNATCLTACTELGFGSWEDTGELH
jgi:hypothetical protein